MVIQLHNLWTKLATFTCESDVIIFKAITFLNNNEVKYQGNSKTL